MLTAAKVFTWIGMICGAIAILPLVFGIITLIKMKDGTLTTGWKVVNLLFVNLISGIILLCMPNEAAQQ